MSSKEDDSYLRLTAFVNGAIDLAEGLERDLKKSDIISTDTVLRLNKFRKATLRATKLLEQFEEVTVKYKN